MKYVAFIVSFFAALTAFADDHSGAPGVGEGAFVALMVQAKDPDAYIAMMKGNSAPFEALGSSVAGVCVTKTGADYPGQMFVWNAFDSIEQAMASTDAYDPMKAPAEMAAMREVKYNVVFKPLKPFDLEPGSSLKRSAKSSNDAPRRSARLRLSARPMRTAISSASCGSLALSKM